MSNTMIVDADVVAKAFKVGGLPALERRAIDYVLSPLREIGSEAARER
jgi:hypothetical protein